MRVLVACEFSGVVRRAFRALGHEAWSCDLLESEDDGEHLTCNVLSLLWRAGGVWDLMIAHPPCTYLAGSGARWWSTRAREQKSAFKFFMQLAGAPVARIAIENPVGAMSRLWRRPDQYIQPWQFGHGETKKTGLWLKNLPLLKPTKIVEGREARVHRLPPGPDRWKERSRTLTGIAEAMAEQWGSLTARAVLEETK